MSIVVVVLHNENYLGARKQELKPLILLTLIRQSLEKGLNQLEASC